MAKTELYRLSEGDKLVFAKAREENNPNRITNFYLRNDDSGTWWRPVHDSDIRELTMEQSIQAARRWQEGYETLKDIWKYLKKPEYFGPNPEDHADWEPLTREQYELRSVELDPVYRTIFDEPGGLPVFHHPHGALMLPWQLDMWRSNHAVQVVVGGFGSGKTYSKLMAMLVRAITLPGYRAFALAPYSIQALEVHRQALQAIEGTQFAKFLIAAPSKPFPHLVLGNDYVGKTTIECYPVLDDSGKILTLTGDEALVDQSEQIPDLDELVRNVGSRFRGVVRGRPRRGQISLVANSGDSPQLWDWYDEGINSPDYVWPYSPGTFENTYLTVADLKRFERQVGKDEQTRKVYLLGERPIGSGEHFPRETIIRCRADYLDEMMRDALNQNIPGFMRVELPRVGVQRWETPPQPNARYVVAADPGWANPPDRNSAGISVWEVTGFPRKPATMAAFHWVYGSGSPNPWMSAYTEYVIRYNAVGFNAFDATGFQAGYERLTEIGDLLPNPIKLSGQQKYVYLNLLKKYMADGLLEYPTIPHLFSQLSKYKLPDDKLRQDLVMMLVVLAAQLEMVYYTEISGDDSKRDPHYDPSDRYYRPEADREIYHER